MKPWMRPVQRSELAEVARLHAVCFPDEAWDSSALATILAMAGSEAWIARVEDGAIYALVIMQCLGEDAEILTLGVSPERRRQGIARAMLAEMFARAAGAGAKRVFLEVAADNEAGLALYRALGFTRHGTRPAYYQRRQGQAVDAWRLGLDISQRKIR